MGDAIRGTIATNGAMTGNLGAVFGKDGKSAYEVAVKNGFVGSEAEWLISLKGADGKMSFEDLTPTQKESLKGDKGEKGNPGVYIGSGAMPADCNVQIDPNGDCFTLDEELNTMKAELSAEIGKVRTQTESIKSDVEGLQTQINEEAHFRGYLSTNGKIQALEATPNDFAYSAQSGTKWVYEADGGWKDTDSPVPDQLTPASDATPLMNGVAAVGTAEAYARGDHRHPTDTTRLGVDEFNEFKSDLEIGLDNIIAIQNSLIGGGSQ